MAAEVFAQEQKNLYEIACQVKHDTVPNGVKCVIKGTLRLN